MEDVNMGMLAALEMGVSTLIGDAIGEAIKFIVYLLVIVCAVVCGSKLRDSVDAKKALNAAQDAGEDN
jgi:hypothetical protein